MVAMPFARLLEARDSSPDVVLLGVGFEPVHGDDLHLLEGVPPRRAASVCPIRQFGSENPRIGGFPDCRGLSRTVIRSFGEQGSAE